jgi:hypothetical protein
LVGQDDEARRCLVEAMVEHGRIAGRGDTLAHLYIGRPLAEFVDRVRDCPPETRRHLITELSRAGDPGPDMASALAGAGGR